MFVMAIIIQSITLMGASALAAGLLCWLASAFAARLHHHGWAAFLVLGLLSALFLSGLTRSEFAKLSALCGLFGALFLWFSSDGRDGARDSVRRSGR